MQVGEKYLSKEDVLPMLKYYVSPGDEDSLSTWYSQVNHAFTKSRRPWFEFPGPGTVEGPWVVASHPRRKRRKEPNSATG